MINYLCDNYPWSNTSDIKNPSLAANVNAPPHNSAQCNSFSTSKAAKLAVGLTAMAGAVALGVLLGLNSGSDKPEVVQAASSASSVESVVAENYAPGEETKSTEQEFYTCSDLEKDIAEALKLEISNWISMDATNEAYAHCDPDNENWLMEYLGNDYYYYDDHSE